MRRHLKKLLLGMPAGMISVFVVWGVLADQELVPPAGQLMARDPLVFWLVVSLIVAFGILITVFGFLVHAVARLDKIQAALVDKAVAHQDVLAATKALDEALGSGSDSAATPTMRWVRDGDLSTLTLDTEGLARARADAANAAKEKIGDDAQVNFDSIYLLPWAGIYFHAWSDGALKQCRVWIKEDGPTVFGLNHYEPGTAQIAPDPWEVDPDWKRLIAESWSAEKDSASEAHLITANDGFAAGSPWRLVYTHVVDEIPEFKVVYAFAHGKVVRQQAPLSYPH